MDLTLQRYGWASGTHNYKLLVPYIFLITFLSARSIVNFSCFQNQKGHLLPDQEFLFFFIFYIRFLSTLNNSSGMKLNKERFLKTHYFNGFLKTLKFLKKLYISLFISFLWNIYFIIFQAFLLELKKLL